MLLKPIIENKSKTNFQQLFVQQQSILLQIFVTQPKKLKTISFVYFAIICLYVTSVYTTFQQTFAYISDFNDSSCDAVLRTAVRSYEQVELTLQKIKFSKLKSNRLTPNHQKLEKSRVLVRISMWLCPSPLSVYFCQCSSVAATRRVGSTQRHIIQLQATYHAREFQRLKEDKLPHDTPPCDYTLQSFVRSYSDRICLLRARMNVEFQWTLLVGLQLLTTEKTVARKRPHYESHSASPSLCP